MIAFQTAVGVVSQIFEVVHQEALGNVIWETVTVCVTTVDDVIDVYC